MKNRFLYLAVVGLPLLVGLSCSKPDDPPASPDQISINFSKKALEYVKLTEGKLLLYRDSATSIVDTVMVTKSSLKKIFYPEVKCLNFLGFTIICPAQNVDQLSLILTSMVSGAQDAPWFDAETQAFIYQGYTSTVDNVEVILMEKIYVPDSYIFRPAFDYLEPYSEDLITMTIEGITYQNVLICYDNYSLGVAITSPEYRKATYYWARGVGIIKRTIVTTGGLVQTSTLVRSE